MKIRKCRRYASRGGAGLSGEREGKSVSDSPGCFILDEEKSNWGSRSVVVVTSKLASLHQ